MTTFYFCVAGDYYTSFNQGSFLPSVLVGIVYEEVKIILHHKLCSYKRQSFALTEILFIYLSPNICHLLLLVLEKRLQIYNLLNIYLFEI